MKPLVVANWKMNPQSLAEAKLLFNAVKKGIKNNKNVEVVICPPYTQFSIFPPSADPPEAGNFQFSNNIKLGAQDVFWEQGGAFTGEISPQMLKNLGSQYVILGHSERRALGETDEMINKKLKAAIQEGLKAILCVGETQEKRKKGKTREVLNLQLKKTLNHLITQSLNHLIVAYEPVWAIGTGNPCDFGDAKKANLSIKEILAEFFGGSQAQNIPILYGGSLNSEIAAGYIKESKMDGLLVGAASLDAEEFIKIVKKVARALISSP